MAILHITFEEYKKLPGLNASKLKKFLRCPAYYKYHEDEDSDNLIFGRACHTALAEPEIFDREFVVMAKGKKRTGDYYEKLIEANPNKTILTHTMFEDCKEMIQAMKRDEKLMKVFANKGQIEVTLTWVEDGIPMKARLDKYLTEHNCVFDYKTTGSEAEVEQASKSIYNYAYDISAAHYAVGVLHNYEVAKTPSCVFGFQEKAQPYLSNVVNMDKDFLDYGLRRRALLIEQFKECERTGKFPSYGGTKIQTVSLPYYAKELRSI